MLRLLASRLSCSHGPTAAAVSRLRDRGRCAALLTSIGSYQMSFTTRTTSTIQQDFLLTDECILVDERDAVVGHASKRDAHRFTAAQPKGQLHRAFSVFLFDKDNRLLLQQRANSKVTFPGVWTNTCCSHQLYGQHPDELDAPESILRGSVPGTVSAALRKLEQELGIPAAQLPPDAFHFLTRLHYCAVDKDSPVAEGGQWGEHEVDYILLLRAQVTLAPNPDEVEAVRYVTLPELRSMMAAHSGLKWSPWFRIIAQRLLPGWWADLDAVLTPGSGRHADYATIHHIMDPH